MFYDNTQLVNNWKRQSTNYTWKEKYTMETAFAKLLVPNI